MSDLIQRLRHDSAYTSMGSALAPVMREAADRIETQDKRIEELERQLKHVTDSASSWARAAGHADAKVEALEREKAELMAAMQHVRKFVGQPEVHSAGARATTLNLIDALLEDRAPTTCSAGGQPDYKAMADEYQELIRFMDSGAGSYWDFQAKKAAASPAADGGV